jgi:SAM-dependent methyltransferase
MTLLDRPPHPPRHAPNPADAAPPAAGWTVRRRDVPYVPTDDQVVRGMLALAQVTPADLLYDLGCGDGRIVLAAARQCGAAGVGVDIDPQRIAECTEHARRAAGGRQVPRPDGPADWLITPAHARPDASPARVRFLCGSLFDLDLSPATVLTLYLLPKINARLLPAFLALRPGTRIVSNTFPMGYDPPLWPPDATLTRHHRLLMKWIVPAPVGGRWQGTALVPCSPSRPTLRARRLRLTLTQHFQAVAGTAHLSHLARRWHELPLGAPRLAGPTLTFHLPTGWTARPLDCTLSWSPHALRGTWTDGQSSGPLALHPSP